MQDNANIEFINHFPILVRRLIINISPCICSHWSKPTNDAQNCLFCLIMHDAPKKKELLLLNDLTNQS